MSELIPFPLLRRRRIVGKLTKQAIRAASISDQEAHDWILNSVRIQRDALLEKGIDAATAELEAESLWDALWGAVHGRSERKA